MKNRNLELCLCERCVAGFYQSKEYWVTREDPYQVIKDERARKPMIFPELMASGAIPLSCGI